MNPTQYRFEHLATQMKWRLQEGRGEAVYQIGVEDNGMLVGLPEEDMRASLKTLRRMAEKYGSQSINATSFIYCLVFIFHKNIQVVTQRHKQIL